MQKFIFCLFALYAMTPSVFAADFLRPTATIERGDRPVIRLNVTWSKLNATDLTTLEMQPDNPDTGRLALIRLLDICVVPGQEECSDTPKKVNFQEPSIDKTLETDLSTQYYARVEEGVYFEMDPLDSTQTLRAQILISAVGDAPNFTKDTKLSTKLVVGTGSPEIENGIEVAFAPGVSEAVQEAGVARSKGLLTAFWKQIGSVAREGGGNSPPSGVLALLLPSSIWQAGPTDIPVYKYNPDFNAPLVTAACSLSVDVQAETCSLDCPAGEKYVLNSAEAMSQFESQGSQVQTSTSSNSASFNNLENGQSYAILLQYLPDGINRACVVGTPSDAMILTEITSGREPKAGEASCFIATAAYGSPLDEHLNALRWFRDTVLLPYRWTREIVRFYYRVGPHAAQYISDKPTLRAAVRAGLWGPVHYIESYRQRPTLTLSLTLASILAMFPLAWLLLRPQPLRESSSLARQQKNRLRRK